MRCTRRRFLLVELMIKSSKSPWSLVHYQFNKQLGSSRMVFFLIVDVSFVFSLFRQDNVCKGCRKIPRRIGTRTVRGWIASNVSRFRLTYGAAGRIIRSNRISGQAGGWLRRCRKHWRSWSDWTSKIDSEKDLLDHWYLRCGNDCHSVHVPEVTMRNEATTTTKRAKTKEKTQVFRVSIFCS